MLRLKTDWMEDAAVGPVGPDGNSSEQGEAGHRPDPAGSRRGTDRPVLTGKRGDTHNCPVGLEVLLAEGKKTLNRPDPVGQHSVTEQSVFLGSDAEQGGTFPLTVCTLVLRCSILSQ